MTFELIELLILCPLLCLLQVVAALPWLLLIDPRFLRDQLRGRKNWANVLVIVPVVGLAVAVYLYNNRDPDIVSGWGRGYGAVLQLQVFAGLFIGFFVLLLKLWPKGGAVALSTFREGVRQPMFWVLVLAGFILLGLSPFLPYFTFGEDIKMLKDLGYMTIMFAAALFGILTASMSISEEIEGRTAITVMSKPISRRNFLLGKFLGILLGGGLMMLLLGWWLVWIILFKGTWDRPIGSQPEPPPAWVMDWVSGLPASVLSDFLRGGLLWVNDFGQVLGGLVVSFGQVMILTGVAVALATRLPMLVNALLCLGVFILGHLTHVLQASTQGKYPLVKFIADVFETVLPSLDQFDMGPAVVRSVPLAAGDFALYTVQVTLYAVIYTAVALLLGLVLFEDRDLA